MSNEFCIYHGIDNDGFCSSTIVKKQYPNVIMIPYNYQGSSFIQNNYKFRSIHSGDKVFIVDVSLPPEIMMDLKSKTDLVWLDHHSSAIDDSKHHGYEDISGERNLDYAACELVWRYFYKDQTMPTVLHLVAAFDRWEFRKGIMNRPGITISDVENFSYATRAEEYVNPIIDTGFEFWNRLLYGSADELMLLLSNGNSIRRYIERDNDIGRHSLVFETIIDNYKVLVANKAGVGSLFFGEVDWNIYDAVCLFHVNKRGEWIHRIYSEKDGVDVSSVARVRGYPEKGGGREGAAGWQSNVLDPAFVK